MQTTVTKPRTTAAAAVPFKSTNFNIQAILLLLFAFLELVGFPIEVAEDIKVFIEATLLAGIGFWGYIRAWIAKGIKAEYTSNVLTYAFAAIGGFVSWFQLYSGELEGIVGQLVEAITTGNINLIFPVVFALGNIVLRVVREKPWLNTPDQNDEGGNAAVPA